MKFSKSDFLLVRWSILAVCASLLGSALTLYSSNKYAEITQKDLRAAQNQLKDARNRLDAANDDQKNMAIYADEYGALIQRKIIGDDRRLDWMEGMEQIRLNNLVIDFRYNIAPQKIYAPRPAIDSGNFDINYSEMKLQFDLLHEGQMLDFFAALRKQIKGQYQLAGCDLKRAGDDGKSATTVATHLKAECNGGWITLKNRNATR